MEWQVSLLPQFSIDLPELVLVQEKQACHTGDQDGTTHVNTKSHHHDALLATFSIDKDRCVSAGLMLATY